MKTRNRKSAANTSTNKSAPSEESKSQTLTPSVTNPPNLFILPRSLSTEARILTLPNPVTATPTRYLLCPERGCFEFTRVSSAPRGKRSWFLAPKNDREGERPIEGAQEAAARGEDDKEEKAKEQQGYVLQNPQMLVATPLDPLFLLLPALVTELEEQRMYRPLSEHLEELETSSAPFAQLMRSSQEIRRKFETMFDVVARKVCDAMELGEGEVVYRLSRQKLENVLVTKAKKVVEKGLPKSLEERFVVRALALGVGLGVIRDNEGGEETGNENVKATKDKTESAETSTSQDSGYSSASATHTTVTASPSETTKKAEPDEKMQHITHLLRLRTALTYISTSYLPPSLARTLPPHAPTTFIDFAPLDHHLAHLASLKKEAQALRSLSDNISRKRNFEGDEEAAEKAEAKKRKKEEEEARKKNVSRGVKKLEKVDRSGMRSLSSFFGKKS